MTDSRWWGAGIVATLGTAIAGARLKFAKARREDVKALIETLTEVRADSAALRVEIVGLRTEISLLRKQNYEQALEMEQLSRNHRECDEKYAKLQEKVEQLEARG